MSGLLNPHALVAMLCALLAPAILLVGVIGTLARKEGGRRLAVVTTGGAAVTTILALGIGALGASSGVTDGIDALATASAASRAALASDAIGKSVWTASLVGGLMVFLVPLVAFGAALIWSVRSGREEGERSPPYLVALGVCGASVAIGAAVSSKCSGFIEMFRSLAYARPEERVELATAGAAALDTFASSGLGIALAFTVALIVMAVGAVKAARAGAEVPGWVVGIAALLAVVGVGSAVSIHVAAAHREATQALIEDLDAPAPP